MKNLEKIFNFYAALHQPKNAVKHTFEEIQLLNRRLQQSEFLKFCKDFEMPITKQDQIEIYRKKVTKQNLPVELDKFCDLLKEIFFVKETEETILMKKREIKVLDESNLRWSMDQKKDAIKFIDHL